MAGWRDHEAAAHIVAVVNKQRGKDPGAQLALSRTQSTLPAFWIHLACSVKAPWRHTHRHPTEVDLLRDCKPMLMMKADHPGGPSSPHSLLFRFFFPQCLGSGRGTNRPVKEFKCLGLRFKPHSAWLFWPKQKQELPEVEK